MNQYVQYPVPQSEVRTEVNKCKVCLSLATHAGRKEAAKRIRRSRGDLVNCVSSYPDGLGRC